MTVSMAEKDRVADFETQLVAWLGEARPGYPTFMLPDAPTSRTGSCVSCGIAVEPGRWRCAECLAAVNHVLAEFAQ